MALGVELKSNPIPYDLFTRDRTELEAKRARRMDGIYHIGQAKIWDGHEVLNELVRKHGGVHVPKDKRAALVYLLSIIMWGEYAAWRVSAQLADRLDEVEPRLAATSQSHDEARHFYVIHDYLKELGEAPITPDRWGTRVIEMTLRTDRITTKLLGMQLTIESVALSLFKALRDCRIEPVLSELMPYYEQDEARHVGLGHQLLPSAFQAAGRAGVFRTQLRQIWLSIASLGELKELEPHLETLGIEPLSIVQHAQDRMLANMRELELAGNEAKSVDVVGGLIEGMIEVCFPHRGPDASLRGRAKGVVRALQEGALSSPEDRLKARAKEA